MEIIGLFLAVIGILFAFEMPRTKFLRFFGYKPSSLIRTNHSLSNHDRTLVKIFRSLFAEPGLIQIYQQHDFLLPLKKEAVRPLNTIAETWTDESHFFSHAELRHLQSIFIKAANDLANEIARYTVPDGWGNVSVITSRMNPESLPSHVRDEAKAIDAKVPAFLESHEKLLAACNKLA